MPTSIDLSWGESIRLANDPNPDSRLVRWQKEWPPQHTVPLGGTRHIYGNVEVEVVSGIPVWWNTDRHWRIEVRGVELNTRITYFCPLQFLRPKPTNSPKIQEPVGTLNVSVGATGLSITVSNLPPGVYDIFKRDNSDEDRAG